MCAMPMRIAFVDSVLEPSKPGRSGMSDTVWGMASQLKTLGHDVHMLGAYRTDVFPDERIEVHQIPEPPMAYRNVMGVAWRMWRTAQVVRRLKPDIVHLRDYFGAALLDAYAPGSRLVLTTPGNIFHRIAHGGNPYEWYYTQLLKWGARRTAHRAAAVVAISRAMRDWWMWTGSHPDRTHHIPLGADLERFAPVPDARRRLGIEPDAVHFLFAGRFSHEKGIATLLDAIHLSRSSFEYATATVTLVGSGQLEAALRAKANSLQLANIVRFVPWIEQDELPLRYSAADAFVLPSFTEGFSRTVIEAMACGTPIIGSRITGTEDHVIPGHNGFLFEAGDAVELGRNLAACIESPSVVRSMRGDAARYAREHLSWPVVVERLVREVYRPVLTANRKGVGSHA
jgi:glycosyltransferase involved in cell wall biosynthesis